VTNLCGHLAELLAASLGARLVCENPGENPFLASFYKDPRRFALSTQLFFLLARYGQQSELLQGGLFEAGASSFGCQDWSQGNSTVHASVGWVFDTPDATSDEWLSDVIHEAGHGLGLWHSTSLLCGVEMEDKRNIEVPLGNDSCERGYPVMGDQQIVLALLILYQVIYQLRR